MAENTSPAPVPSNGTPSSPPDGSRAELILFLAFLKIAAVTVGGGYAILAAAREEFTVRRGWLTEEEFTEMVTVVVTVPGLIAVNAAIYLGWKLRRLPGALAAAFGALLPSVTVIMLIAAGLSSLTDFLTTPWVQGAFKGILCGIIAMIGLTAFKMGKNNLKTVFDWTVALLCLAGIAAWHWNPALLVAAAIAAGVICVLVRRRFA